MADPTTTYVPVVLCAVHHRPLIAPTIQPFCPQCRGRLGGAKRTKAQQKASQANVVKARAAKAAKPCD